MRGRGPQQAAADAPPASVAREDGLPTPLNEPDADAPRHRAGRSGLHLVLRPGLLWPLAAVAVLVALALRAARAGPRPGEGLLAADGFTLTSTRAGLSDPLFSPDGVGALHTAVYAVLTRAFARHDTLIAAGRELVLVATLITAVLLWRTGRRLGLGDTACAVAVLLAGIPALVPPPALVDSPARLAVPWLVGAACLVAPGRATASARVLAACAAAVAVLLAPVTLLLLLAGAAVGLATGGLLPRLGRRGPVAALVPVAGFVVVLLLLDRWDPHPATAGDWGLPAAAVWSLAALFVVIGLLAARYPSRLRPAGAALAVAGLLAVLPPGRLAPLAIGLPLAALLVVTPLSVPVPARSRSRGAVAAAALALALGVAAAVVVPGPGAHPPDARATQGLLGWAATQLPASGVLVAERRDWAELLHSGGNPQQVRLPGTADRAAPLLTVTEAPVPAAARLVARFDSPGTARPLELTDRHPGTPSPDELARRRSLAAAILANPTTHAGPQASAVLQAAAVDMRLLTLLAALVAREGVGADSFPPAAGELPAPAHGQLARRVLLTAFGDQELRPGARITEDLRSMLAAQPPPFTPAEVAVGNDGVLVGFRYVSDPDGVVAAAQR